MNLFKKVQENKVSVKLVGLRPLNKDFYMATIVVAEKDGRVFEDIVVMPVAGFSNDRLDAAMELTLEKFFAVAPKTEEKIEVKIGDTPVEVKAEPEPVKKKITKKKARKNRKTKEVETTIKDEENPFKDTDDVVEVIAPKVVYDPKNEAHKLNLNIVVSDLFGSDWKGKKKLKDAVLKAVAPLKKEKCMHEGTGEVSEETLKYLEETVNANIK